MNKNVLLVALVAIILLGGVWYLASTPQTTPLQTGTDTTDSMMMAEGSPMPSDGSMDHDMVDSTVQEVVIEGSEFKFDLENLTFKKGQPVKLTLKNTGKMPHDWVVDELNARTEIIEGGEETTIEFTPDTAGTFEFYCSVGQHRAQGMVGSVTVEE